MWSQCPKGPNKTCFYKYQWWYLTFRRYILNGDTAPTYTEKGIYNKRLELRVKVHGVSLSRGSFLASSRECQIRPRPGRDSGWVMTPFMQVDNYSTRNFAQTTLKKPCAVYRAFLAFRTMSSSGNSFFACSRKQ